MNLKKIIRKDADGNSMSFEFDIPKANVPPVDSIPNYDHPGEPKGSDTVPAWLTPGENIVNAEASRLPGNQQIIDQMNNQGRAIQAQQGGSIPTYADGGGLIDIARTATEYAPYMLAGINSLALPAGLWGLYKSNRDGKRRAAMRSEGGPIYAAKGTESATDTSWVDGILDALRFVESGEITDPSKLISSAGAEGFYQIMPANFGELTEKDDAGNVTKTYKGKGAAGYDTPVISREDAYDPEKARAWAKAYLTNMQLAHPEWSPADVLRAYNWGPGNMKKFMREDVNWADVPTEAKQYTDKVFKHYKNLTGENFYDTTSNAPELAGLRNAIPVPGETDIPSGDLSMAELMIPDIPDDESVEVDVDGPGQNLPSGPGGVPDMPMNFMGSANPRRGYESGEDYLNRWGIPLDPRSVFSTKVSSSPAIGQIYEGAPPVPGMDSLYQTYPKDITPDYYPTQEQFIKGPGVPPQAEVDPTSFMERRVAENEAEVDRVNELNQLTEYWDPYGEFGEYVPPTLTPVTEDYAPISNPPESEVVDPYAVPPDYVLNPIARDLFPEGYQDPMQATYAMDKKKADEEESKIKAKIINKDFMEKSGFDGASEYLSNLVDWIVPDELEEAGVTIPELIFSPEAALEKVNNYKEKVNQEKISKEKFNKGYDDLLKTYKAKKAEEVSNKLDAGSSITITETSEELTDKYESVSKYSKKDLGKQNLPPENKVVGFFKDLLGDIFDVKELKRAAVMYLGGRLLGYDHATAGGFAVKNMLTRMDNQETARAANIKAWAGKYTPASLDLYNKSGKLNDLIDVGAKMFRQGTFQDFYGMVNGRQVTVKAEKVHVGTGDSKQVKWMLPNGQLLDTSKMSLNAYDVPKTEEYENRVVKHRKDINSQLTTLRNQIGKIGSGDNIDYATNINVDTAAGVSVEWALANGVDLVRLPGLVDLAYKSMVNDSGRSDGKPSDIEGYLNDIIIKQSTNEEKLFKNEEGTPMSAELFQTMTQNIEHILASQGQQSDFTGVSNYINIASQVWSGTNQLKDGTPDPDNLTQAERDKWNSKSSSGKGADTTGFYEWLQTELAKEMG